MHWYLHQRADREVRDKRENVRVDWRARRRLRLVQIRQRHTELFARQSDRRLLLLWREAGAQQFGELEVGLEARERAAELEVRIRVGERLPVAMAMRVTE